MRIHKTTEQSANEKTKGEGIRNSFWNHDLSPPHKKGALVIKLQKSLKQRNQEQRQPVQKLTKIYNIKKLLMHHLVTDFFFF